jgi:hypothetical protein
MRCDVTIFVDVAPEDDMYAAIHEIGNILDECAAEAAERAGWDILRVSEAAPVNRDAPALRIKDGRLTRGWVVA